MDALNSMEKIALKSTTLNAEIENKDSVIRGLKDDLHKAKRHNYVRELTQEHTAIIYAFLICVTEIYLVLCCL